MDLQCLHGTLIDPTQNVEDKLWVNFANISVKFLSYLKLVAKDSQVSKLSFCESHANGFSNILWFITTNPLSSTILSWETPKKKKIGIREKKKQVNCWCCLSPFRTSKPLYTY